MYKMVNSDDFKYVMVIYKNCLAEVILMDIQNYIISPRTVGNQEKSVIIYYQVYCKTFVSMETVHVNKGFWHNWISTYTGYSDL